MFNMNQLDMMRESSICRNMSFNVISNKQFNMSAYSILPYHRMCMQVFYLDLKGIDTVAIDIETYDPNLKTKGLGDIRFFHKEHDEWPKDRFLSDTGIIKSKLSIQFIWKYIYTEFLFRLLNNAECYFVICSYVCILPYYSFSSQDAIIIPQFMDKVNLV